MKMTRLALGAKCGVFGFRSYVRSLAMADSAANNRSCCNMEFTAIAPKPTAASCNACLRVRNLFMASFLPSSQTTRLVTIQKVVCPEHRLNEQAEAFLRIRFRGDGLFRDLLLFGGRWPAVGLVERELHRAIVIVLALFQHLLREGFGS